MSCRKGLIIVLFAVFVGARANGQDYKKVIDAVQKMETKFRTMIANEEKARRSDYDQLSADIRSLREGEQAAVPVAAPKKGEEKTTVDPLGLIERLQRGNQRFVEGNLSRKEFPRERPQLIKGQHPYAIVLTCSDSRVPPELVFDESLGQLFVVRTAGNLVDSVVLGSIEYAAEDLHVGLMVVLGHESCGAVKVTIEGGSIPPNIGSLVRRIQAAADHAKAYRVEGKDLVEACVEENVRRQMEQTVVQSALLNELVEKGEFGIAGAVYDLGTGKVTFLGSQ